MGRPPRIELPGALYYIYSGSRDGSNVFLKSDDASIWLETVENVCCRYEWRVYAYCLMPDHYHLLAETIKPTLSIGMRQINGIYTQKFNNKYGGEGQIFSGRFRSVHVQKDIYTVKVARYMLMKPVKQGYVRFPYQYKWSSARYHRDLSDCPDWLDISWADNVRASGIAEDNYNSIESPGSVMDEVKNQIYLGDSDFITSIKKHQDTQNATRGSDEKYNSKYFEDLLNEKNNRNQAIYEAYLSGDCSMKEIGDFLSLHHSTISRIIKKMEDR